jgi:chromosome segregation ATPase
MGHNDTELMRYKRELQKCKQESAKCTKELKLLSSHYNLLDQQLNHVEQMHKKCEHERQQALDRTTKLKVELDDARQELQRLKNM